MGFTLSSIDDRLDEIRTKRERLWRGLPAQLASYRERWERDHREHGRAAPDEVAALEQRASIVLPEAYRRFVIEIADGGLGPGEGLMPVEAAITDAPELFGPPAVRFTVEPGKERFFRLTGASDDDDAACGGVVLLAHTGCGCFDTLVVTAEHRDEVWGTGGTMGVGTSMWSYRRPDGSPAGFLDWYEGWLDGWLR